MTKEHIILDQKSIGVSQYFFGLSERKNGIRYEEMHTLPLEYLFSL